MSHSSANIFFQDGTVLYGEYTGDQMQPSLYSTITEVIEHWRVGVFSVCDHEGEVVVVNVPHFYWNAMACKECRCITSGFMPDDDDTPVTQGDYVV